MKINEDIFKAYDIRGTYPEQIDKKTAFCIGFGLVQFLQEKTKNSSPSVVVGQDARPSSPKIFSGLVSGINKAGGDLITIGQSSTPMLYFGVNYLGAAGGVMITASHNPAGTNGMKLTREKAIPISADSGMEKIKEKALAVAKDNPEFPEFELKKKDIQTEYVDFLTNGKEVNLETPIVIDFGNGMAGPPVEEALNRLEIPYKALYSKPDCRFPNHEANPLKEETLAAVKTELQNSDYLLGAAFDGDGDRVGFLTEKAKMIGGDFITALLARSLLKKKKTGKVIYDLRSSKIVPEVIKKKGGKAVETRVGHSFIKGLMREEDADFAGELSSHFYFPFQFDQKTAYFESGIMALLEILELISKTGKSLSELVEPLQKYYQSGEINFELNNKDEVMKKLERYYEDEAGRISHLDGVKIDFEEWWFNLRPSNTEPYLRLNLEAETKNLLEEKVEEVRGLIEEYRE